MSRLLLFVSGFLLLTQPAFAQVCEQALADWGGVELLNASLWRYLAKSLLSPLPLSLTVLAVMTVIRFPRLRGIMLIAGLVATARAATAIGLNVLPDNTVELARLEGCGGIYVASAITSSFLALILLGAFLLARTDNPGPHA